MGSLPVPAIVSLIVVGGIFAAGVVIALSDMYRDYKQYEEHVQQSIDETQRKIHYLENKQKEQLKEKATQGEQDTLAVEEKTDEKK